MKINSNLPAALDELADVKIPMALAKLDSAATSLKTDYNANRDNIIQAETTYIKINNLLTYCDNFKENIDIIQKGIRLTAEKVKILLSNGNFK